MFRNLFSKILFYIEYYNFYKRHVSFGIINGRLQITSISHEDYVVITRKNIDKIAKNKNREEIIKFSLAQAVNGCNFIIFYPENEERKFVQYWTGSHQLQYDFEGNKNNKLTKLYRQIVGLLSEFGFVNDATPDYRGFKTFQLVKQKNKININANFKKDINSAAVFTEIVFKEIYKVGDKKLVIKIE